MKKIFLIPFLILFVCFTLLKTDIYADNIVDLSIYNVDLDERYGIAIYENIPINNLEYLSITLPYMSSNYIKSSSFIRFDSNSITLEQIYLDTYDYTLFENGVEFTPPIGSTDFDLYFYFTITDEEFLTFAEAITATIYSDTTPPTITNSGIYFADVSNPVTLDDILLTLSAYDETDGNITSNIINVSDNYTLNSNTLGDYDTIWEVSDSSGNISQTNVTVRVVDITKPVITLVDPNPIYIEYGSTYTDSGAIWTDNYDGTGYTSVSDNVDLNTVGSYVIEYNYTDTSGNIADTVYKDVYVVDTTKPLLTLNGDEIVHLEYNDTYTELGATYYDIHDGSGDALITGTVDTSILGTYTITYNYTDSSGNVADTITRTVIVEDTIVPALNAFDVTISNKDNLNINDILSLYSANDNYDGDISLNIITTIDNFTGNEIKAGVYTITVSISDSNFNITTKIVTITVLDEINPVITPNDYLLTLEEANQMTLEEIIAHMQNQP